MKIYKKAVKVNASAQIQLRLRDVEKMQKLIIVAALVACALAAPLENIKESFQTADLSRPSPINPDIESDPKPEEKVILITDAEEQALEQTEDPQSAKLPGPYVPGYVSRSKRADKDSSESEEDSSEEDKKPSQPVKPHLLVGPSTTLLEKIAARTSTTSAPASSSTSDASTSDGSTSSTTTTTTTSAPKRPYSPLIHQHNEHRFRPTTEAADSRASSTSTTTATPSVVASNDHINDKRDIPVPLTRKYHHDDDDVTKQKEEPETDKAPKEEVKQEEKDEDRKTQPSAHPATIPRPIPVAELFAKKPSTTE